MAETTTSIAHVAVCANCQRVGGSACTKCLLVTYCSKACRSQHWSMHKLDCESPLRSKAWRPRWAVEGRTAKFMQSMQAWVMVRKAVPVKFLLGSAPGSDILRLNDNEGREYKGDLKVLFAASGDLRNVIKTVTALPQSYTKPVSMTINDGCFDVVARNIIVLLLAMKVQDHRQAASTIIHLWYSSFIRASDLVLINEYVRPMVEDVCAKISDRSAHTLQAKTWTIGKCSIRVILEKANWEKLLQFLAPPASLTTRDAEKMRASVWTCNYGLDAGERDRMTQPPDQRRCFERFTQDGMLLPFGHSRADFNIPNPTFFQDPEWFIDEEAEPYNGWRMRDILNTSAGGAVNDVYGKLYRMLEILLVDFRCRLVAHGAAFEMRHGHPLQLPSVLVPSSFARIETYGIAESIVFGVEKTVQSLAPLLQSRDSNRHATLFTYLKRAAIHTWMANPENAPGTSQLLEHNRKIIKDALGSDALVETLESRVIISGISGPWFFPKYAEKYHFERIQRDSKMIIKDNNTIVEKWPTAMRLQPGEQGYEEEFATWLMSQFHGNEHYIEWARVGQRTPDAS